MAEVMEGNIEQLCKYLQMPRDRHVRQAWRIVLAEQAKGVICSDKLLIICYCCF